MKSAGANFWNLTEVSNCNDSDHVKRVLQALICENSQKSHETSEKFITESKECQELSAILTPEYRGLRSQLVAAMADRQDLFKDTKSILDLPEKSRDDWVLTKLEQDSQDLKQQCQLASEKHNRASHTLKQQQNVIESIVGGKAKSFEIDVTEITNGNGNSDEDKENLSTVLEKLLNSVQDMSVTSYSQSRESALSFPLDKLNKSVQVSEKHKNKFVDLQINLESRVLPELSAKNQVLKSDLERVNWKEAFPVVSDADNKAIANAPLLPPTPGLRIQTTPGAAMINSKSKFLLASSTNKSGLDFVKTNSLDLSSAMTTTGASIKQSTPTLAKNPMMSPEQSRIDVKDFKELSSVQDAPNVQDQLLDTTPKLSATARSYKLRLDNISMMSSKTQNSSVLSEIKLNPLTSYNDHRLHQESSLLSKSGFSSINEERHLPLATTTATTTQKYILSPGLFDKSSNSVSLNSPRLPADFCDTKISDVSGLSPYLDKSRKHSDFASFANTPGGKVLKSRLNDLITTLGSTTIKSDNATNNKNNLDFDMDESLITDSTSQPNFSDIDF